MLTTGTTLHNRYEIVKSLGNGDFGSTYLVNDAKSPGNPACVIKHLQPRDNSPRVLDASRQLFETEAKVLAQLGRKSPQMATLLDHFEEQGEFFLVWEFIDGHDLTNEIIPREKLGEAEVVNLLKSILEVLVVAHTHRPYPVIHRDLKPANLIRRRDGKLVLIDFGEIRQITQLTVNAKGEVTPALALGTPGYQPREQARGKPQLPSDIYAVGMIGIQALTGIEPQNLAEDANKEIIWQRFIPEINPKLAEVLDKMASGRFVARYQNASEALQALGLVAIKESPGQSTLSLSPYLTRRRLLQLGGLAGAGLVVGLVGHSIGNKPAKTFQFQTVKVDATGAIIDRPQGQAEYFTEDLGNGITLDMVKIPGGTFLMGSPTTEAGYNDSQGPQHQVTIPSFYMGRYAVTQEQYEIIMGTNPSGFKGKKRPVENVSWNNTGEFCQKLLQKTGKKYRLPSEAEWEYACRAGTTTPFYFGETITPELVNYNGDYPYGNAAKGVFRKETMDVGRFPPNAFGLYDMHGNVWQQLADRWHKNYKNAPTDGSSWETVTVSQDRVMRGGSFYDNAIDCRSANRFSFSAEFVNAGFRLVVS